MILKKCLIRCKMVGWNADVAELQSLFPWCALVCGVNSTRHAKCINTSGSHMSSSNHLHSPTGLYKILS